MSALRCVAGTGRIVMDDSFGCPGAITILFRVQTLAKKITTIMWELVCVVYVSTTFLIFHGHKPVYMSIRAYLSSNPAFDPQYGKVTIPN